MDRTDERDTRREVSAELDVRGVAPTVPPQPAAGAEESSTAQPTADDQVIVGDIPDQRPGFLPRPALMAQLNRVGPEESVVLVLTGTWGAGKTQLAAAYARARLETGWRLVAWVDAGNAASLLVGLAAVADAAGLSDGGPGWAPADAGLSVRRWLESDGARCLLVFDNAEDPDVLRPFVPVTGMARVLITAARESVADLGASVPVGVFSAEEALALLNGRTGLADDVGAAALASELGYLPLALDQAAAVIAEHHIGYRAYLGRLGTMPVGEYAVRREEQPYPRGAAEAVLLSLEALRAADTVGVGSGLLDVMAVLSAAGVRRELLHAAGEAGMLASNGSRVTAEQVDQTLAQLAERALLTVTVDGQSAIMHGLVARVVRQRLTRQGRLAAACRATASAQEAYTEALMGPKDHAVAKPLTGLPDDKTVPEGEADEELALIQLRLRFLELDHLIEPGDGVQQAIAVGEPLAADLERVLGPGHPDTLNALNSLAAAYRAAGRAADAIPLVEQTLVGWVKLLGPDHPSALTSQHNLATTYQEAGRVVEAILLFRLTLAARERLLGTDHLSTLNSRRNLASAYRDTGRIAEAIPLFEQTLAGQEHLLGSDHPDTQRSRTSLAAAYRAAGRAADAIPLVEQTLASRERVLGTDHPRTLSSRNNLAAAHLEAGQAAEAIPLFEQTLAACERLLGADDPRTQATRNNLALAHHEAGRAAEASPDADASPDQNDPSGRDP